MTQSAPNLLVALADWAGALPPLVPEAEAEARLALVDTLAAMLAGRDEPQVARARAALVAAEVSGPSRSVVADMSLPAASAAFLNGVAAHALDYDDYERLGSTHPGAALAGSLVALAEARSVALGQVTRAYAVGYEAICRLGQALGYGHYERGWHATSTLGPIGAAAASAHLMGLAPAQMVSAMSLGATMSAGMKRQFGSDAKAVHAGLAARGGVEAATLAGAGIEAQPGVIEGAYGFISLYGTERSPGTARAIASIGDPVALVEERPLRKPWPSCAYTHRAIEAAVKLSQRPGFRAKEVAAATLRIPEPFLRVAGFTEPKNANEARFSARYCVAAALLDGKISPASFGLDAIGRADIRAMLPRVALDPYPLAPDLGDMSAAAPDTVTLRMRDRSEVSETVAEVFGGPGRPMTEAEIAEKFLAAGGAPAAAEVVLNGSGEATFRWSAL